MTKITGINPQKTSQRGYVVLTVALLTVVLVGMAALAVDVGVLLDSRTTAQQIADSAALAGAFSFVVNPTSPQPDTAIDYARTTAVSQNIRGALIQASEVDVQVDVANQLVTVTIDRTESTNFARVLNILEADIRVEASAEASGSASGSDCTKPWMLPNIVLLPAGSNPCSVCPGDPAYDPALAAQVLVDNGAITPFAISRRGSQVRVTTQRPENALAPGQFYAIRVSTGSGAAVYRANIASCSNEGVFCRNCYRVESGNMVGPTRQGVRALIGNPPDTFNSESFCYDPGCRDTSPSLIVAPIWDVCNTVDPGGCQTSGFCPDGDFSDSGANITVRVIGFALLFVEGIQGPDVVARLIDIKACPGGAGGGDGTEEGEGGVVTGHFSVPLRLVRTQ